MSAVSYELDGRVGILTLELAGGFGLLELLAQVG